MSTTVDTALVEGLRMAVPLHILTLYGRSRAELLVIASNSGTAFGHRGDALQFPAQGPAGRRTAAEGFNALARGLAAAVHLNGVVDAFGLHWCVRDHDGCPHGPEPATGLRPGAYQEIAERAADLITALEALMGGPLAGPPADRTVEVVLEHRPALAEGEVTVDGEATTVTYTYAHGAPERDLIEAALYGGGPPPLRWVRDRLAEWVVYLDEPPHRTHRYRGGLATTTLTGRIGGRPVIIRAVPEEAPCPHRTR
ncbi:hypothetical protein [Nocardiopsis sp. NPDC057823]|uniref:hypothetical protein n=1 Tax=Nocardiopsis sp. NPDC057823 TaxID=3346256 RepID=UPI00366BC073